MKTSADFFAIWGGISGCQHGFALLLSEALSRMPADRAIRLVSSRVSGNVARRFRVDRSKGSLAEGFDADLVIVNLSDDHALSNRELLYRHPQGPYDGRRSRVRIVRTIVGGRVVYSDGRIAPGAPGGHFIRPDRS
jgi:allantoinase